MEEERGGRPEGAAARYWIESLGLTADEERLVLKSLEMADRLMQREAPFEESDARPDATAALRREARMPHVIRESPSQDAGAREPYVPLRQEPYVVPVPGVTPYREPSGARDARPEASDPQPRDRRGGERRRRPRRPDRGT
jgi:hypothetical protein